jgi:spore maturation protein CgeB
MISERGMIRSIKLKSRTICPGCGGSESSVAGELNDYSLARCKRCGLVYAIEVPTDEDLETLYNQVYKSMENYKSKIEHLKKHLIRLNSPKWQDKIRALFQSVYYSSIVPNWFIPIGYDQHRTILKPIVPKPGDKLLEIGCGSGTFLVSAKAHGWEVEGFDLSSEIIEATIRIHGLRVSQGNIDTLDLKRNSYKAIVAWEVLEHLINPREYLRHIKELLKTDGGVFACSVPNHSTKTTRFVNKLGPASVPPIHLNFWDCKSFRLFAQLNGFDVLYLSPRRVLKGMAGWDKNYCHYFWNQLAALVGVKEGSNIFALLSPSKPH